MTPLPNRLISIHIQGEEVGPLLSNMVIPLDIVSLLLAQTIIGPPNALLDIAKNRNYILLDVAGQG